MALRLSPEQEGELLRRLRNMRLRSVLRRDNVTAAREVLDTVKRFLVEQDVQPAERKMTA